jgi:hypothetical protein
MFGGADRYVSFGYMALITEPDYEEQMPLIRVDDAPMAYYVADYLGRVAQYFTVSRVPCDTLCAQFPAADLEGYFRAKYGDNYGSYNCQVVRWYDRDEQCMVLMDESPRKLASIKNPLKRCPVRIVERPKLKGTDSAKGQFDDVIWVQIARALTQMYTINAIEQAVNAPVAVPKDVDEIEIGPFTTSRPTTRSRCGGWISASSRRCSPSRCSWHMEQRTGSRYPEGRSGNMDASVITGQGVQALMGTFDTQVQTFQRLLAEGLEDVSPCASRWTRPCGATSRRPGASRTTELRGSSPTRPRRTSTATTPSM